jgi:hypothetical protein
MRKIYFSIILVLSGFNILFSQSIEYDPARSNPGPFYNYTVVGFFTTSPPVIDAIIDDYCWTRSVALPTAVSGGAGFDGINFPANQQIKQQINVADNGTIAPNPPPTNPYTSNGGVYPSSAGTFGMCWDLNYVYFAVKITNQAAANLTAATNDRGMELYFNNGNGRSGVSDPINDIFPKKYNNLRDMQVQLWYLPKPGDTDFPLLGAVSGLANYGISMNPYAYRFAVKKTPDGYIYEGRIAWTVLNKEFINEADGSYVGDGFDSNTGGTLPNSKWRPLKGRLLGLDIGASLFRGSPGAPEQMQWNQCCYQAEWSRSSNFGYFLLAGDTSSTVCPTAFNVTLTNSSISSPNQKVTVGATSIYPLDAAREINWQLIGSNGSFPIASIDNNTGIITPLNNGVLTIVGKSKIARCGATTITGAVILTIGAQVTPTDLIITGTDIITNWGTSALVASAVPSNAPGDVIWSIEPASNLATINSITGLLKSTALGSGSVIVKATSIANGLVGTKIINISTPVVISNCIGINAYQKIYQCDRTLNAMTIFGFNIGTKVNILAQYYDPANPTVPQAIPPELIKFTIQQNVPAASISQAPNWELVLNQPTGFFSITGVYLNDTTKRVQVRVTMKGTITPPGCSSNIFNIGTACGNAVPGVNVTSVTIASSPSSLTVGNSNNYLANVLPANATNPSVNWYSSNTSVGTINSSTGYFYASSPGTTTITAISISTPSVSGSKLINVVNGSCGLPLQSSAFDNNSTSINAGLQSYNILSVAGVTYAWTVTGSGNFVAFDNGNSAVINWANPGTLSITPMNSCGNGSIRSLFVSNVNGVSCTPPSQPGDFDNKSTTVCPRNMTYKVSFSNSVAYVWSVTGTGNSIFTANSNIATINWVNPGTLYVTAIVGSCQSVSRSLTIFSTSSPAKPTISTVGALTFCSGKSVVLTSSSSANNIWSSGESTQSITVTGSGSYTVTVGENCSNTSDPKVVTALMPPPQSICIITVDNATNHNQIVFEKPSNKANIKKWLIYRETTTTDFFDFIGTVFPNDQSLFVDNTSQPDARAYRYKIQTLDTCGNSVYGDPHKTVHLTINKGLNDHSWNLIWNAYEGINVVSYRIYRGTSAANLAYIDAVSASFVLYTDANAPNDANLYYLIEILTAGCNPNARQESYESIRSNVAQTAVTNIKSDFSSSKLIISPNPSNGSFIVDNTGFEPLNYKLINSIGVIVGEGSLNTGKNTFSLNLSKGVYLFLTEVGSKKISIE